MTLKGYTVVHSTSLRSTSPRRARVARVWLAAAVLLVGSSRYAGAESSTVQAMGTTVTGRGATPVVATAGRGALIPPPNLVGAITPTTPRATATLPIGGRPTGFSTIKGQVANMDNVAAPNTAVRLRDARAGRIVTSVMTDQTGSFSFQSVNPGTYVAEVVDQSQQVVAASQMIMATADQAAQVALKLPARLSMLSRILGTSTPGLTAMSSQAAGLTSVATGVFGTPVSER